MKTLQDFEKELKSNPNNKGLNTIVFLWHTLNEKLEKIDIATQEYEKELISSNKNTYYLQHFLSEKERLSEEICDIESSLKIKIELFDKIQLLSYYIGVLDNAPGDRMLKKLVAAIRKFIKEKEKTPNPTIVRILELSNYENQISHLETKYWNTFTHPDDIAVV